MTAGLRSAQAPVVETQDQLREWLSQHAVHGLEAEFDDYRRLEGTKISDGEETELVISTDLFRSLDAELVWMHEAELPEGTLLALKSQLVQGAAPAP